MLCRAHWKSSFITEVATLVKYNVIIIITIIIDNCVIKIDIDFVHRLQVVWPI